MNVAVSLNLKIDFPDLEQGNNLKAVGFKPTHRSIKQWEDTLSTFPVSRNVNTNFRVYSLFSHSETGNY